MLSADEGVVLDEEKPVEVDDIILTNKVRDYVSWSHKNLADRIRTGKELDNRLHTERSTLKEDKSGVALPSRNLIQLITHLMQSVHSWSFSSPHISKQCNQKFESHYMTIIFPSTPMICGGAVYSPTRICADSASIHRWTPVARFALTACDTIGWSRLTKSLSLCTDFLALSEIGITEHGGLARYEITEYCEAVLGMLHTP